MLCYKFPPGFQYQKDGIRVEEDVIEESPEYEELLQFVDHFVSIREKYCPITNYDISGRASRGIFVGIPDCGIQAVTLLQNNQICEVATCTFSADRRSSTSRNCYLWGCESKMKFTSFGLVDAIERWYPLQAVMTPIYLDVSCSIPILGVSVKTNESITIRGIDLKEILERCFSKTVPFVVLRIQKQDLELIQSYNLSLRACEIVDSRVETVSFLFYSLFIESICLSNSSNSYIRYRRFGISWRASITHHSKSKAVPDHLEDGW